MLRRIGREMYRVFFARWRVLCLMVRGLRCGTIVSPLSNTSASGNIKIGSRTTIKRTLLDAGDGSIEIGNSVWLNYGSEFSALNKISIGHGTTIQRNTTINGDVIIGAGCLLAPNVFISSSTHVFDRFPGVSIREQEAKISRSDFLSTYNKQVTIGDDVWVGANVVVMPGVTIGSNVVVGANSVVTQDVKRGSVVAGVPAKFIKYRLGFEEV